MEAIFSIDGYIRENQPVNEAEKTVIEYIGSGKKGIKTINISTPSALIASAAGALSLIHIWIGQMMEYLEKDGICLESILFLFLEFRRLLNQG